MKPRNKKQQHIVELNGRLRPLTTAQKQWAFSHTIDHYAYRLKSGMCTCMKCGYEWLETRNGTNTTRRRCKVFDVTSRKIIKKGPMKCRKKQ